VLAWLPFEHIAFTPLQIYLGKLDVSHALRALATQWSWIFALLILAHLWWNRNLRTMTIQGG
jgi:ABC-2 type transport system permease protein